MHSRRDYVVAALGALGAVVVVWSLRDEPPFAAVAGVFVAVATWVSIIDFNEHRIPNRIIVPASAATSAAVLVLGVVDKDIGRALVALVTAVGVFVVLVAVGLIGGIGMGDVKFSYPITALLAWAGVAALQVAALTAVFVAGAYTIVVLVRARTMKRTIAFGPFMTAGLIVGLALTASL